jgi:hypothetical protein
MRKIESTKEHFMIVTRPQMIFAAALAGAIFRSAMAQEPVERWSAKRAQEWQDGHPWLIGCNFTPSTAINQLEMFQEETFDIETIDRELGYAQSIGFNTVRVYLHDLLWQQDAEGFLTRLDTFLSLASEHDIRTILVLFDGVWNPQSRLGDQPEPTPGVHNSGWLQNPDKSILGDPARHGEVEAYTKGVMNRFKDDPRVLMWDLYNEPDNTNILSYRETELKNKMEMAFLLLRRVFEWARAVNPSQPLTAGIWQGNWSEPERMTTIDRFMVENSDVITFHCYGRASNMERRIEWLKRYDRPMVCTEYMARPASTFQTIMPILRDNNVGGINWGLVAGKTQTNHSWRTWGVPDEGEPDPWFHDIFRPDGTPYREDEVEFIRSITGAEQK